MLQTEDDFRAEVLIAFWLENGETSLDNIAIQPKGTFRRPYSKDILQTEQVDMEEGNTVTLHISREGLYDMLPEGLFHQIEIKIQKSTEESVEESRRYKQEEKAARKLFLPLEQEFYRQRIWLEHTELRTWLNSVRPENVSLFLDFWGVRTDVFSTRQSDFMLALLPHLHRIVGDMKLTAYCLEIMMQEKIHIENILSREQFVSNEDMLSRLGSITLGVDTVPGDSWIDDEPALQVTVGAIAIDRLLPFLPGGIAHKQLQTLYGFFFPAETDVSTCLSIEERTGTFKLVADESFSRLGLTTVV